MNNYTRGQETFFNRIFVTIQNLFRLTFFSIFCGICSFGIITYFKVSRQFWDIEKEIISSFQPYLRKFGLIAISNFFELAKEHSIRNFVIHKTAFLESFKWSVGVSIFTFIALFLFFLWRGKLIIKAKYKRGSRLISSEEFNKEYTDLIKQELNEIKSDSIKKTSSARFKDFFGNPFVCSVDGIKLPEFCLYRHLSMVGSTGVGKSTLIKFYLEYCRFHGEKVIIPDINGEYASEFFQEGDIILSLFDKKTSYWNFAAEKDVHASEFAKFLVPSGDERNAFWWKGARQVIGQLLSKIDSPEDLWRRINSESDDLSSFLTGLAKKITGKEGSPQATGVTGSSLLDLGFLEYLNRWPKDRGMTEAFSLYDWSQNNSRNWVFLTFADTDKELMSPLLKLWLNTVILGLLRRRDETLPPLNLVIDELNSLGKIEFLPTALERARKYRGKVILGYQSESQLMNLYGKEAGQSIKANTGTKFVFRSPEQQEAKELSDYLGRQEVGQKNVGTSYGSENLNDRESINEHDALRNIVLDSEIRDLPDGHFYLKSLNINPVKSRIVKKRWDKVFTSEFCVPAKENFDSKIVHVEGNREDETMLIIESSL